MNDQHSKVPDVLAGAAPRRSASMSRVDVARIVDHTLLRVDATTADVVALCTEAADLGAGAVCVSPTFVATARALLPPTVLVATVCGFPSGKHTSAVKAFEARAAAGDGADEIDMVADIGMLRAGELTVVEDDIAQVVAAAGPVPVKVILETAALTAVQIVAGCRAAEAAGAAFVKTSTGFHPAGGASVAAVAAMAGAVGGRLGIKASGGIRDAVAAAAMIDAGATRLGLSATAAVLGGWPR